MALRYSSKGAAVATAGTTFTHALGVIPDAVIPVLRGPTPGAAALYVVGTPTSQSAVVAASGAAGTGDIYVYYDHSMIR